MYARCNRQKIPNTGSTLGGEGIILVMTPTFARLLLKSLGGGMATSTGLAPPGPGLPDGRRRARKYVRRKGKSERSSAPSCTGRLQRPVCYYRHLILPLLVRSQLQAKAGAGAGGWRVGAVTSLADFTSGRAG
jgi:hypothetical protein